MISSWEKLILSKPRFWKPLLASFHRCPPLSHLCVTRCSSQRTHALLSTIGSRTDPALTTKMIQAHCKAGRIDYARCLFDEMPGKNIISFSTMIYGYATNGFFIESFRLFALIQESGLRPNSFTIVAILVSSAGMKDLRLGESIHGWVVKGGLASNPYVQTAMLDTYAKCGCIGASYSLFRESVDPNLVTCNAMITAFVYNDRFEEALLLFKQLRAFGLLPNYITLLSVTQSCVGYALFELCAGVHGYIVKSGFDLDVSVMNSVLQMYLTSGNLDLADGFFRKMALKDVITWTSMMGFLLEHELFKEALDMFHQMRADGMEPDMVMMVNMNTACALLGDLKNGVLVHAQIIVRQFGAELPVTNSLIAMYSKCGDLEAARMILDGMVEKTLVSWTAMISGYVQNGKPREALKLLSRMRTEESFRLDSITLVSLFTGCSELSSLELCKQLHNYSFKSGLLPFISVQNSLVAAYGKCGNVDHAHRVFQEMINHDIISWNVMISACGINGKGVAALAHFHGMKMYGQQPDCVTYLNILKACNHSGLVDNGMTIFERMVEEKRIEPSREHWGCLVDMLARAGRLADAKKLVDSMRGDVSENAWKALLAGCCIHTEMGLAEVAADKVLRMDSADSSHVVLLSNVYASEGKFEEVETLRSRLGKRGLTKNLGFTLLDAMPHDVG